MYYSQTLGKECSPLEFIEIKVLLHELKKMATKELYDPIKVIEDSRKKHLLKIINNCDGWELIEDAKIDDSESFLV